MLVLAACVIALASPLVVGRWPAGLALYRWRWPALIWVALALQIVVIQFAGPGVWARVLHVGTYVAALGFLWMNRGLRGVLIVGAGALSNAVTIALNGGVLPASQAATEAAGLDRTHSFDNSTVLDHPVLPWLGDVFAWPAPLPLANTFSIGDVLIVVGVAVAAWTGARPLRQRGVRVAEGTL